MQERLKVNYAITSVNKKNHSGVCLWHKHTAFLDLELFIYFELNMGIRVGCKEIKQAVNRFFTERLMQDLALNIVGLA